MSAMKIIEAPSPNFNDRREAVDMLVLHYTGMESGPAALRQMQSAEKQVSAHYMVEENGEVYRLVPEDMRAWHAGVSRWAGQEDLNSRSVGVEIVNGGHDFGLPNFAPGQIEVVIELSQSILKRWDIPQVRVVGHSDIAPDRKQDPGEKFPWRDFARAGVGLWPEPSLKTQPLSEASAKKALVGIGYDESKSWPDILIAFQRRWSPQHLTGAFDLPTLVRISEIQSAYLGSAS